MHRIALPLLLAALGTGAAAATNASPPQLRKLDAAVGRWVFHGKTLNTAFGKPGAWTWHADCGWSPGRLFLECSFDNEWSGKAVKSLVVDTYNAHDHAYWHYEIFAAGAGGAHPFVSRMAIDGATWIEYGTEEHAGKRFRERIVYRYASPTRVAVAIEVSKDGTHWTAVDRGEGVKQP